MIGIEGFSDIEGHGDLLQGGIAGSFADAVDIAFHLAGPVFNCGQGIGHCQPQIIVAVDAQGYPVHTGNIFPQPPDQ